MTLRRALWTLRLVALSFPAGCTPAVPEGVFHCVDSSQCPSDWVCEARSDDPVPRCFERPTMAVGGTDASDIPWRTGPGTVFVPDTPGEYACGRWKHVRKTDAPPANAKAYGIEYRVEGGARQEYLCRFATEVGGQPLVVQGRAVFGEACLAPVQAGAEVSARREGSEDFEVLVDSEFCARMMPYYSTTHMLQTGTDTEGKPTFSCLAIVKSAGNLPEKSQYLGRFDPKTERCVFEYYSNLRSAPEADPTAEESMLVLARP